MSSQALTETHCALFHFVCKVPSVVSDTHQCHDGHTFSYIRLQLVRRAVVQLGKLTVVFAAPCWVTRQTAVQILERVYVTFTWNQQTDVQSSKFNC